ncbi:MAG: helix-turn-helix transcriptional regulator [Planctomycetes bacterium]|nr:helix-turn-helix transcriptional regulator [Planctomycetota bacterium]
MRNYRALTGRLYDLGTLSQAELEVLDEIRSLYLRRPSWDAFARQWVKTAEERLWKGRRIPVGSPLYRIAQDLELRLGIAEGRVARPDYRDMLADLIEGRFQSRYAFCKASGIDQGNLSRVLAGKKHLSSETLFRALEVLGVHLEFVAQEEGSAHAANPFPAEDQPERLRRLQLRIDALEGLAERAKSSPPDQRPTLLGVPGLSPDDLEPVRVRIERGESFDEALHQELASALREQATVARKLADTADARRSQHARAAG